MAKTTYINRTHRAAPAMLVVASWEDGPALARRCNR